MVKFLENQELAQYNCLLDGLDSGDCVVFGRVEVYSCKRTTEDKKLSREIAQRYSDQQHSNEENTAHQHIIINNNNTRRHDHRAVMASSPSRSIPFLRQRFQSHRHSHQDTQPTTMMAGSYEEHSVVIAGSPSTEGGIPQHHHHHHHTTTISSIQSHLQKSPSALGPLSDAANRNTFTDLVATLNALYQDYDFRSARPEDFVREPSMELVYNAVNMSLQDTLSHQNRNNLWAAIDRIIDIRACDIYTYIPRADDDGDPLALGGGKIWSWNYFFHNRKEKRILFFACYARSKLSFPTSASSTSLTWMGTSSVSAGDDYHDYYGGGGGGGGGSISSAGGSMMATLVDDGYQGGGDDEDSDHYQPNPKNMYFHAYPRTDSGHTVDSMAEYDYDAISYGNYDDDDDDDPMMGTFDDM